MPGVPDATIEYEPAESRTAMYGGNSNWRGPVWFPINYLVIRALLQYDQFFGPDFTDRVPDRIRAAADPAGGRRRPGRPAGRHLAARTPTGAGPCTAASSVLQTDPAWRDNLLFFEYFHGDNGAGLGAMHQTGWTALVADLIIDPPGVRPGTSS